MALPWPDFVAAAAAFCDAWNAVFPDPGDGWEWCEYRDGCCDASTSPTPLTASRRVRAGARPGLAFLRREATHWVSIVSPDQPSAEPSVEFEAICDVDVATTDVDSSPTVDSFDTSTVGSVTSPHPHTSPNTTTLLRVEHHIVYSVSYQVPVLYARVTDQRGRLVRGERLWEYLPATVRQSADRWTTVTELEHPVVREVFTALHPCRTVDLMRIAVGQLYLVTWASAVGPILWLTVPRTVAEAATAAVSVPNVQSSS